MISEIILLDGIKYLRYIPKSEKEFEGLIVPSSKNIFGHSAIYLDIKKKISNALGQKTIPDGFLFYPEEKRFVLVEVELSSHDVYTHISKQVSKFISAFSNHRARQKLASLLKEYIEDNPVLLKWIKPLLQGKELYEFLEFEVFEPIHESREYEVVVLIEEKTKEVIEALNWIKPTPSIIEVAVYAREGAEAVKMLRFESLYSPPPPPPPPPPDDSWEIYARYKGVNYKAELYEGGKVTYNGKKYNSPSAAGTAVTGKPCNGWDFWKVSPERKAESIQSIRQQVTGKIPKKPKVVEDTDQSYYFLPAATSEDGTPVIENLHRWLDTGMWGLDERTAHRKHFKVGDKLVFNAKGIGVVASATVSKPCYDLPKSKTPGYPCPYAIDLKNVKFFENNPVNIYDPKVRGKLELFGKDPNNKRWGVYIQSTRKISEGDFKIFVG